LRRIRGAGRVARRVDEKNARRNETIRRPRQRWMDTVKRDFEEIGWGGMDWINLVQDMGRWRTLVNTVMNLRVP
jgi:hypothetical protein